MEQFDITKAYQFDTVCRDLESILYCAELEFDDDVADDVLETLAYIQFKSNPHIKDAEVFDPVVRMLEESIPTSEPRNVSFYFGISESELTQLVKVCNCEYSNGHQFGCNCYVPPVSTICDEQLCAQSETDTEFILTPSTSGEELHSTMFKHFHDLCEHHQLKRDCEQCSHDWDFPIKNFSPNGIVVTTSQPKYGVKCWPDWHLAKSGNVKRFYVREPLLIAKCLSSVLHKTICYDSCSVYFCGHSKKRLDLQWLSLRIYIKSKIKLHHSLGMESLDRLPPCNLREYNRYVY